MANNLLLDSNKPVVAVFRNVFLPYSETFIYEILIRHRDYHPVGFAKRCVNWNSFPGIKVITPENAENSWRLDHFAFSASLLAPAVYREFKKVNPQVIHAHFGQSGVVALPYAKAHNIPLIVNLHGNDVGILLGNQRFRPRWWFYALSHKRLLRATTLFLASSQELKEQWVSLGCPENRVRAHTLGIDLEQFKPGPKEPQKKQTTVVMIGRLVEKKGFEYGIRAFAAVCAKSRYAGQLRLVIIGDGPLENELRALSQAIGIAGKIDFRGVLDHDGVRDVLRQEADIMLSPSVVAQDKDRDSGLMVAKEAAACEVPVVGTFHGGIPEIIDSGKTGFLVPERDPVTLASALRRLVDDPKLRRNYGQSARKKMLAEYDIEKKIAELESIYSEIIAAHKRKSRVAVT